MSVSHRMCCAYALKGPLDYTVKIMIKLYINSCTMLTQHNCSSISNISSIWFVYFVYVCVFLCVCEHMAFCSEFSVL